MRIVTSITIHNTSEGKRMSVTSVDVDTNGQVIGDNKRDNFILFDQLDPEAVKCFDGLMTIAQNKIDAIENKQ